jgi:hypothetical protein
MLDPAKFRLTGYPLTRDAGESIRLVSVRFVAERKDGEVRSWHVRESDLLALFEILPSEDLIAKLMTNLREGLVVAFPGNYSAMQLVLLGFRAQLDGMPMSVGIPTSLSTYSRSDRMTRR